MTVVPGSLVGWGESMALVLATRDRPGCNPEALIMWRSLFHWADVAYLRGLRP